MQRVSHLRERERDVNVSHVS